MEPARRAPRPAADFERKKEKPMLLMMIIMSLPLLGIGLFFVLPLAAALPAYLAVVGFSGIYQWLMMRAMHLPARTGTEGMMGSKAVVLNWEGTRGQVICEGEIWQPKRKVNAPSQGAKRLPSPGWTV
jgi:membrane protein implicated in regulation of membrane protease activity